MGPNREIQLSQHYHSLRCITLKFKAKFSLRALSPAGRNSI